MAEFVLMQWQLKLVREWIAERLERSGEDDPAGDPAYSELRADYLAWCAARSKDGNGRPVGANTLGSELQSFGGQSYSNRKGRVFYHGVRLKALVTR